MKTTTLNIKIADVVNSLNEQVKGFTVKGNHHNLHQELRKMCNAGSGLFVSSHTVNVTPDEGNSIPVAKYSYTFNKDKRTSEWGAKGVFSNVVFSPVYPDMPADHTIRDIMKKLRIEFLKEVIEYQTKQIPELQAQIAQAQKFIDESEQELATLI